MIRKMIVILLIVMTMLTGCGVTVEKKKTNSSKSMFVLVEKTDSWDVVYHKDTKVMYAISNGGYNAGTFTVMLDADGKPLLYKEGDDDKSGSN